MPYEKAPVKNTFRKGQERDFEYETPQKGAQIMGLVSIKNVVIENQWGTRDGYRLVFRSRSNPNAFLNYEQASVLSDRSNLGKALKRMTGGAFDEFQELKEDEAYNLLMECENKWFEVQVKHNPWTSKDGKEIIFAKVDDNDIRPISGDGPAPVEFFKQKAPAREPDSQDFSGYEDVKKVVEEEVKKEESEKAKPTTLEEDSIGDDWDIPF